MFPFLAEETNTVPRRQPQRREIDYANEYLLFDGSSDQREMIGSLIEEISVSYRSLYDIGCADALLTKELLHCFDHVRAIEPNRRLYELAKMPRCDGKLRVQHGMFPRHIPHEKFGTVLASHVLYHVDICDWPNFFRSASNLLEVDGILVVFLWNRNSEAYAWTQERRRSNLPVDISNVFQFERELKDARLDVHSVHELSPRIAPASYPAASAIVNFLLGGARSDYTAVQRRRFAYELEKCGLSNRQTAVVFQRR